MSDVSMSILVLSVNMLFSSRVDAETQQISHSLGIY